ncbi:hypothetical protein LCGC14_0448580 [marine sediment metagenome]|uniref:Cohesin domain-containing protein n=1 Tax=marine sediment metagenome TaxID=412755 RepID=A0A0F9T1H8_9ZZZZ
MAKTPAGRTQGVHQADGGFQTDEGVIPVVQERVISFDDDGAAGAAGVLTMVPVAIPAGATILDIRVHTIDLFNAGTSAALIVGDTEDPNGFYDAVDLKATDLVAEEELNFADSLEIGVYLTGQKRDAYRAAATNITATITLVGTAATTGELRIIVIYANPVDFVKTSTFVAA